ncbi:MAG: type II toxin-antitoxin system VapC family toxin [Acetobacteraceae bacterium]
MLAVDTNIIVRVLTDDDPAQAAQARDVLAAGDVLIRTTVLLETEWVLRRGYGFARGRVVRGLRNLCGLPGVVVEDLNMLAQAFDWAESGMDMADALHLAGSSGCAAFVSFDRALARSAERVGAPIQVRAPR